MTTEILIVDDEADIRGMLHGILQDEGYATRMAANSQQAYAQLDEKGPPDLVILDIWLQHSEDDGLGILANIKKKYPFIPVIMISGHGTIETAVSAIKQGAYDFIEKPFKADRILLMIERALEAMRLKRENESLKQKVEGPAELIGDSPVMTALRQNLARVAQTNSRVFLTGAPGTGKDIAARAIHRLSKRADGPFMAINCAILRPESLEEELFGVEGSGSESADKKGVLESAHGGTLFLDEVADMPLETQGKIVRVLQEQKIQRVGGQKQIEIDVRVIASTNRDLESLIAEGKFRQDLFYRLNVVPIAMPPLSDHKKDISALASHFAQILSRQSGMAPCSFSEEALLAMQAYDWPGNVRQLRNVVEWIMIMGGGGSDVTIDNLPPELRHHLSAGIPGNGEDLSQDLIKLPLREAREAFEKNYLASQIKRFGGNVSKTAQFVEMERSALHRKLKQLGLSDPARQDDGEDDGREKEKDFVPEEKSRKIASA